MKPLSFYLMSYQIGDNEGWMDLSSLCVCFCVCAYVNTYLVKKVCLHPSKKSFQAFIMQESSCFRCLEGIGGLFCWTSQQGISAVFNVKCLIISTQSGRICWMFLAVKGKLVKNAHNFSLVNCPCITTRIWNMILCHVPICQCICIS